MNAFDMNFLIQTTITAVVLVSMAFRMKGKYLAHLITMIAAVVSGWTVFGLASSLFADSVYIQTLTNPTLNLATLVSHAFLGLSSFISGMILIALLLWNRALSGRSNLVAKIVTILWVLAYAVGAMFYVILHVI
jgi:hypothetical protein